MQLVDITHTTKPADRPHPDAQLFRNLDTGETYWEHWCDVEQEPEPESEIEVLPRGHMTKPAKRASKKGEGDA